MTESPLVSIGLPVFNGEMFLGAALDSLLSQSYPNLEIVISDNASTDATPGICERYAQRDSRIRYSRLPENIGGVPNHNLVFTQSRGSFFVWAAHDDVWAPEFVAACVTRLQQDPGAVLAHPKMGVIDESGHVKKLFEIQHTTESPRASERFREFTAMYSMLEAMSGIVRSEVLRRTRLFIRHPGNDRLLFAEVALHGRFVQVPAHLYFRRDHAQRAVNVHPRLRDRYSWVDPRLGHKRHFPHWAYLAGYTRAALTVPLPVRERLACARVLLGWMVRNRRELLEDLLP
jgi:glycosyltransferase involved in cell wall biosynthesis